MRCLQRNKKPIYYALYQGKTEIIDANGYKTGQFTLTYSTPKAISVNVSASKGASELVLFGSNIVYDRTIVVENVNCEIDEFTKLWVEAPVYDNENELLPHDYIVIKKAKSLNSITYAIRKVEVSGS